MLLATAAMLCTARDCAHAQTTSDRTEIGSLIGIQVDVGRRFARAQARRLHERMELLRDASDRQTSGYAIELKAASGLDEEDRLSRDWRALEAKAPGRLPALAGSTPSDAGRAIEARRRFSDDGTALWSAGSVEFGRRGNGMLDIDRTSAGIASGFDTELSPSARLGLGLSFDRAIGEAGAYETRARGQGLGAALYGSLNPTPHTFLDAAVGTSRLDYANARYRPDTAGIHYYERSGLQGFGSVSAGYEHRDENVLLSPYGRFEVSRTALDGVSERIGGTDILIGDQTVDSVLAVLAIRGEYTIRLDRAVIKPGARAEYTHEVSGAGTTTPLGGGGLDLPDFAAASIGRDALTIAPGVRAEFGDDWTAGVEYRNVLGNQGRDETISLRIGHRF
uniref:Outer membrane autotransporter barrel domain-containing protein n=2 Tax=Aureimonas frigidaquae TaxID=424757 RepID=A0A0P0Z1D7_9HYPH|nr:outer membrane autotransporter barrel domain-containing protein [Aureimonas frigidaquae]